MAVILGLGRKTYDFKGNNGEQVHTTGYQFYLGEERKDADGWTTQKGFYLSDAKLADYAPTVGDEVEVFYNQYGKPNGLRVIMAQNESK